MSEQKSKIKKYQLIKFIGELKDEGTLAIDRIPCHWVRYDAELGHTVAKFPPPPYTEQTYRLVERLIRTEGAPMSNWPEYPIDLVGHADTYKDSIKRLGILETESYAYTTDTEVEPHAKAAKIIEELKIQSLEALMKVPAIEDEDSAKLDSSFDQEYDSQTSSEETVSSRRKITKVKGKIKSSVKPQVPKTKVVKPLLRGKSGTLKSESREIVSEPKAHAIESTKAQNNVKEHVPQNKDVKIHSKNSAGPSRSQSAQLSNDDIGGANFVQESGDIFSEPEQNVIEGAEVQNKVRERVPPKEVDKSDSKNLGLSISQSPSADVDIAGDYFVQESGELVSVAKDSIEHEFVLPTEKKLAPSFLQKPSAFDNSLKEATQTLRQAEKEYSKDTLLLLSTLKGLSLDLKDNTNAINNLCAMLQNNTSSLQGETTRTAGVLESHFDLPFQTVEVFKEFDSQLQQDAKYRQHCAASLVFYIDPDNHVSKSMTNIIKKFVGRDVAMNFTAVKQTSKKEILKGMKFYDIMFEVLTKHHTDKQGNPICEKYFNQCLGHALSNAKDWDGFRVERAKKELEKKRLVQERA